MMRLRAAGADDARLLWVWRNHPDTRRMFRDAREIAWVEHLAWVTTALGDGRVRIWIGEDEGRPVGVVRLNGVAADAAEISVVVDPGARRRGYGTAMVRAACACAARELGLARVEANIKSANTSSVSLFTRAGFVYQGMVGDLANYAIVVGAPMENA